MPTKIDSGGGYQQGYDDGNSAGYSIGYNAGKTDGYAAGYRIMKTLTYGYASSTDNGAHTYYSDVCDTENSNNKTVNYMLFATQQYNFQGTVTLQGSYDNNAWANIDSFTASNGAGSKIGNATVSYRFFRYSAYHFSGYSEYKALMCAVEQ